MKKLFLLPVGLLCLALASNAQKTPAPPPPPPEPPKVEVIKFTPPVVVKDGDDFRQRNPQVRSIWTQNSIITLTLKDKTKETYNLENKAEHKKFTDKYGAPPTPPPPPPAPPVPSNNQD